MSSESPSLQDFREPLCFLEFPLRRRDEKSVGMRKSRAQKEKNASVEQRKRDQRPPTDAPKIFYGLNCAGGLCTFARIDVRRSPDKVALV